MALTSFVVLRTGEGWTVYQDGEPLEQRGTRAAAVDAAFALAARLDRLGAGPRLLVQDAVGELQLLDLSAGQKLLARLLADRRASPAQA